MTESESRNILLEEGLGSIPVTKYMCEWISIGQRLIVAAGVLREALARTFK